MHRRFALIACLCLPVLVLVAAAPAVAKTPKGPAGLRFYKTPKHLPAGKHGDVIWARKIASPLSEASRTYLVLYRSKSIRGKTIGVTGTLMLPHGKPPKRGWPVISWAHGTSGIADSCAPSRDPNGAYTAYMKPQLSAWLKAGDAVASTDYEGLGTPEVHPYLVGRSEGRGVLDIVRAARQLDRRVGKRYLIAGHSQGGQSALFAAALGPSWAPELRLRGVAAFAPASHLGTLSRALPALTTPSGFSALAALVLRGVAAAYPSIHMSEIASDRALPLLPQVDRDCLGQLAAADSFGGIPPAQLTRPGADLDPLNRILDAQNPNLRIAAPVLLLQGESDTTVFPFLTNQLDGELRARKGNKVTYVTYPGIEHVGIVGAADARTRQFFKARLR